MTHLPADHAGRTRRRMLDSFVDQPGRQVATDVIEDAAAAFRPDDDLIEAIGPGEDLAPVCEGAPAEGDADAHEDVTAQAERGVAASACERVADDEDANEED